ncbi:hypothetical protein V8F06_007711 [Rhypophila decipiens]
MATMESPAPDSSKKKKPSLFKRTVPRKKPTQQSSPEAANDEQSREETDDLDFFSRSKEVFPMALKEVLEEQKPPSPEKHDCKRRKVSIEQATGTTEERNSSPIGSHASERRKSSSFIGLGSESDTESDMIMDVKGKGKEIIKSPKLPSPTKSIAGAKNASPGLVQLENEEDGQQFSPSRRSERLKRRSSPVVVDDRDCKIESTAGDSLGSEETEPPAEEDPVDEELSAWIAKAQQQQAATNPNAIVMVLLTSRIPDTKALSFKMKPNGTFDIPLETWVIRQQREANFDITEEDASRLLLTWKGHKIYRHSTPASLGVEGNDRGQVNGVGEGYKLGNLHIEVWTEENYAVHLERERVSKIGLIDGDEDFDAKLEDPSPQPPPRKGIKVILKSKTLESLNTTVFDDTTVSIIIQVFRKQRGIGPERKVEIWYDGEKLDDDSLVTDADIDPDDTNQLEVHVK